MNECVTPCVGVCRLERNAATCVGCGRTLAEIAAWTSFSDEQRRAVMARLAPRAGAKNGADQPERSGP